MPLMRKTTWYAAAVAPFIDSSIANIVDTVATTQRPFLAAILQPTSIHTNLAIEDELHRRLIFASVLDLTKDWETKLSSTNSSSSKFDSSNSTSSGATARPPTSDEPFAMSAGPGSPNRCLSLLLSYINEPCVVIGRNQNPWQETNFKGIGQTHEAGQSNGGKTKPVELARRSSGGGAVYHDLGNVCFSFLTHRTLYDPARSVEILRRYLLSRLAPFVRDVDITTTKRNDLFLFGHKITGSAMKVTSRGCFHHLTLLVASERADLGTYLKRASNWEWVTSLAVDSVRSPVTTLATALQLPDGNGDQSRSRYPSLVPTDRFANNETKTASPYERLLWYAHINAPFGSDLNKSDIIQPEVLETLRALSPHEQAKLIQRDFCHFYSGRVGQDVQQTYLSQDIVARKQNVMGDRGQVAPVPFVSSEYRKQKTVLLEAFEKIFPTLPRSTNENSDPLHMVDISKDDLATSEVGDAEDHRSADRKLSDPKTIMAALQQQRSRIWLLRNTPKFTTMVRVPAVGVNGWAFPFRGLQNEPKMQDHSTQADPLPDILIRTELTSGGVVDNIKCRFDYRLPERASASPSNLDISEEESQKHWFSAVMGVMLCGKHLRTVCETTGTGKPTDAVEPFPALLRFAGTMDANTATLLNTALERSLPDSTSSFWEGDEAPSVSPVASATAMPLMKGVATGDVNEVVLSMSDDMLVAQAERKTGWVFKTVILNLIAAWEELNAW